MRMLLLVVTLLVVGCQSPTEVVLNKPFSIRAHALGWASDMEARGFVCAAPTLNPDDRWWVACRHG